MIKMAFILFVYHTSLEYQDVHKQQKGFHTHTGYSYIIAYFTANTIATITAWSVFQRISCSCI